MIRSVQGGPIQSCRHRALCAVLCCACALFPAFFAPPATAGDDTGKPSPSLSAALAGRRFSATRPFTREIPEEDAAVIAETAARAAAMRTVVRFLVSMPEVGIAGSVAPIPVRTPNLLALANAAAKTSVLLVSKSRKTSTVTVTVALLDDEDGSSMASRVRDALVHPDRLDLYEKAVLREKSLLDAFDSLMLTPDGQPKPSPKVSHTEISGIINEIKALAIFKTQLPSRNGLWKDPDAVRLAMRAALELAPESVLCRNAMGDASLQIGRSQEAFEEQTLAIRADPSFARAFHSRGAASLALGHLSSAVADFSEAIRIAPHTAGYYRARGMAQHLLGERQAMCKDLQEACSLGECEEFQWAAGNGHCPSAPAGKSGPR